MDGRLQCGWVHDARRFSGWADSTTNDYRDDCSSACDGVAGVKQRTRPPPGGFYCQNHLRNCALITADTIFKDVAEGARPIPSSCSGVEDELPVLTWIN